MAIELTTVPTDTIDINNDLMWFQDVSATPDEINALTPANLLGANLVDIRGLIDPNVDSIPFWDDSAGHIVWLSIGSGLSITGTTIAATGGGGGITNSAGNNVIMKSDGTNAVAAAGVTQPSGFTLSVSAQASGEVAARLTGNTSDDADILRLIRGGNGGTLVSWNMFGDETVSDRIKTYQYGGATLGGWHPVQGGFMVTPNAAYCFTNTTNFNTIDGRIFRRAAGVIAIDNNSSSGATLELLEQTAPSAGGANTVRIYAEDNGAGKTRLMALFNTGAAQQIAIQP